MWKTVFIYRYIQTVWYSKCEVKRMDISILGSCVAIVMICYIVGMGCKASKRISDEWIPVIMADIKEAGLKLKDGKILGLNDLIEQMKQSDASAFVDESQQQAQQNQARFTTRVGQQQTPGSMTKKDIEAIKDPSERQAAIAQNIQLFQ
jgi:hypothetical protein